MERHSQSTMPPEASLTNMIKGRPRRRCLLSLVGRCASSVLGSEAARGASSGRLDVSQPRRSETRPLSAVCVWSARWHRLATMEMVPPEVQGQGILSMPRRCRWSEFRLLAPEATSLGHETGQRGGSVRCGASKCLGNDLSMTWFSNVFAGRIGCDLDGTGVSTQTSSCLTRLSVGASHCLSLPSSASEQARP